VLSFFVALLYHEGLSGGTVKSYLLAVCRMHISMGLGDPNISMLQLEYVVKVMKKTAGRAARVLTLQILCLMKQVWQLFSLRQTQFISVVGCSVHVLFAVWGGGGSLGFLLGLFYPPVIRGRASGPCGVCSICGGFIKASQTDTFNRGVSCMFLG